MLAVFGGKNGILVAVAGLALKLIRIYGIRCYTCRDGVYDRDCRSDWIECPHPDKQICMTEMRQENGQVRISKGCKQRSACDQHVEFDYHTCTDNPMTRLCFECCDTDLCNGNMYLPPLFENNPCGVTKIRPFLNLEKPGYADEMWAGIPLRKRRDADKLQSSVVHKSERFVNRSESYLETGVANVIQSPLVLSSIPEISLKLAGGREVIPGAWAWVAQIKRSRSEPDRNYEEFICAGTLIHNRWVLTAAQCVHEHHYPFSFYSTHGMYVVVGAHQLANEEILKDSNHQKIDILSIHEHRNYRIETTPRNDIALLELASAVELSTHVQPVCLPSGRYPNEYVTMAEPEPEDWCWLVGWGFFKPLPSDQQKRPDDLSPTLQQARQYPLDTDVCNSLLSEWKIDMTQHMCAVGAEEYPLFGHPCEGDGGGPLVCQRRDGNSNFWFIAGVEIGQSALCGFGGWEKIPAIYSRVSVFENWINSVIQGKYNLSKVTDA